VGPEKPPPPDSSALLTEKDQRGASGKLRWEIQKRIFDRKLEQEAKNPHGVYERTMIDHLAYCLFRCDDCISDSTIKAMMMLTQESMRKFDMVVYFPLYDWEVERDGLREDHFAYRLAIDKLILGMATEMRVPYSKARNVSPEERVQEIQALIRVQSQPKFG
jgi:hypothetical protein